jgi:GNAT superfamily N-acetyltransferase
MTLTTRPMGKAMGERAFVAKSWVESYASSSMARLISTCGWTCDATSPGFRITQEYWDTWHVLVSSLLDRCYTYVAMDDDLIAGFVCWEPWEDGVALHYVYTRLMYRRQGVAKLLLGKSTTVGAGSAWTPFGAGSRMYYTHRSRGMPPAPEGWIYTLRPLLGARRAA